MRPSSPDKLLPDWIPNWVQAWAGRALAASLLVLAAAWPFRDAWLQGELPGAGPDVSSTVWGMWWFQQSWTGPAWGGLTTLVNAPNGAYGSVLSPSSAMLFALSEPILGLSAAACLAALLQIAGVALGVVWLAKKLGLGSVACWAAGFFMLVGRYLIYDTGEGSLVAVAAIPLPIGLGLLTKRGWGPAIGLAACIMWAALENPYLALILPLAAGMSWLGDRRLPMAIGTLIGCLGTLGISHIYSASANPDYPNARAGEWYHLGPWRIEIVDLPWARASLTELFWPTELSWTVDSTSAMQASGGLYLGWSLLFFAGLGLALSWRRASPWLAAWVVALLLSLGSFPGGPFVVLNGLMDSLLRPLTQPTRFLVLASICLSILGAIGLEKAQQRFGPKALILLLFAAVDTLVFGGLSLTPPTLSIPSSECLSNLDGGVLIWPLDARLDDPTLARMLQLHHKQPTPHRGIASWRIQGADVHTSLQSAGFTDNRRNRQLRWKPIIEMGYQYLVVLPTDPAIPIGLPAPKCESSALALYHIQDLPDEREAR